MSKKKLALYNISNTSDLMITPGENFGIDYKGKWKETFGFKKIVLELACGKGHYTVGLAEKNPDTLYIGVDIKGDRFARGIDYANEHGLKNVRFIRGIIQHLERWFDENEVDEIWIIHPDPRPRESDKGRRLTSPRFLKMYEKMLVPGGKVRLKTDAKDLYSFSLESAAEEGRTCLTNTSDLHNSEFISDHEGIVTDYEKLALDRGETICYGMWQKK